MSLVADLGRTYTRLGYSGDDWPRISTESYIASSIENVSVNGEWDQNSGQPMPTTKVNIITGEKLHGYNPGFTYEPLWRDGSLARNPLLGDLFTNDLLPSLNLESKTLPLLISEDNAITKEERKTLLNVFLESNITSHFMMMRQSLLSLYACGKINGAVIDSSSNFTTVSTIEEGYFVPEGYSKVNYGGESITDKICEHISKENANTLPEVMRSGSQDLSVIDSSYFEYERKLFCRKIKHALLSQNSRNLIT